LLLGWFSKGVTVPNSLEQSGLVSRREFTVEWALAMLAGVVITVSGCSDSPSAPSDGGGGGGGGSTGNVTGDVSANHGHVATVTAAQITAAGALSLPIMGTATHPHTVSLSATQVQQIGARQRVAVTSTTDDGHTHTVTFN
jgi:VCBS repeat-containing protein